MAERRVRGQRVVAFPADLDVWLDEQARARTSGSVSGVVVDAVRLYREVTGGGASELSVRLLDDALAQLDAGTPASRPRLVSPRQAMEPVGMKEIAERLGYQVESIWQWRAQPSFPKPRWSVSGRPAWDWPVVERWARRNGRAQPDGARNDPANSANPA